jgi:hypothetical protein
MCCRAVAARFARGLAQPCNEAEPRSVYGWTIHLHHPGPRRTSFPAARLLCNEAEPGPVFVDQGAAVTAPGVRLAIRCRDTPCDARPCGPTPAPHPASAAAWEARPFAGAPTRSTPSPPIRAAGQRSMLPDTRFTPSAPVAAARQCSAAPEPRRGDRIRSVPRRSSVRNDDFPRAAPLASPTSRFGCARPSPIGVGSGFAVDLVARRLRVKLFRPVVPLSAAAVMVAQVGVTLSSLGVTLPRPGVPVYCPRVTLASQALTLHWLRVTLDSLGSVRVTLRSLRVTLLLLAVPHSSVAVTPSGVPVTLVPPAVTVPEHA